MCFIEPSRSRHHYREEILPPRPRPRHQYHKQAHYGYEEISPPQEYSHGHHSSSHRQGNDHRHGNDHGHGHGHSNKHSSVRYNRHGTYKSDGRGGYYWSPSSSSSPRASMPAHLQYRSSTRSSYPSVHHTTVSPRASTAGYQSGAPPAMQEVRPSRVRD